MTYTEKRLEQFDIRKVLPFTMGYAQRHPHEMESTVADKINAEVNYAITQAIEEERERVEGKYKDLQPMNTAPKDGTTILGLTQDGVLTDIFWSERPVCMLGTRNGGFPEGWATGGIDTDYNLPIDTPMMWKDLLSSLDKSLTTKQQP